MPDTVKGTGSTNRKPSLITMEEWIKIVSKLYEFIDKQLGAMENRHNLAGSTQASSDVNRRLDEKDTRHLNAIARAIERVQVVNEKITEKVAGARARKALKKNDEATKEFKRRLARFVGSEGE